MADDTPKYGRDGMPHGSVNDPRVFISIAPDGTVSIVCHRSEMGQGVRTGMPLIVADEMEADWARVKVVQALGDEVTYGNQDTDGSRSTRHFMLPMRQCGAAARMMLEEAAAKRWSVALTDVEAKNHEVVNKKTGAKLGYGELSADAAAMAVPAVDCLEAQGPRAVPLYRQGGDQDRRRVRHHDRTRHLWAGCLLSRHEIRCCGAPASAGRESKIL